MRGPACRDSVGPPSNRPCSGLSTARSARRERPPRGWTVNSTSSLTFLWTPWSAGLSAGVVLLAAGLCLAAWRRSGYARSQGLLELFRLALIAVTALTLNQPEWVEEFRPEEKPAVVVLWDDSPSMGT